MKKLFVFMIMMCLLGASFAQTKEELKAERQQLKSELTSKDNAKMEAKYAKLVVNGVVQNQPQETGIQSIDGLINTDASLLNVLIATETILKDYINDIKESEDGEVEINKYTPGLDTYLAALPNVSEAVLQAVQAATQLAQVKNDVKGLNPMSAGGTIKAATWAMDALPVTKQKLEQDAKLLQNLINSCKAAKNL